MGLVNKGVVETLRCLHCQEIGTVNGVRDNPPWCPFDRIADWETGDNAGVMGEATDDPVNESGRNKRPGSIVDENVGWIERAHRIDAQSALFLACLAAVNRGVQAKP